MYIIAGLGNPGVEYQHTRHNAGFDTIDILSEKWNIVLNKNKFKAQIGEGFIDSNKVILLKPQTYMNASGESIKDAVCFYKLPLSNLIVIYDDIDLDLGKLRIRPHGSAGTHNGMRSIVYQLGDGSFPRIRIGTGSPVKGMDLASFVLSHYSKDEQKVIFDCFMRAAEAVPVILNNGVEKAMNHFNG